MSIAAATGVRRVRAHIEGTVQGVGFRPYVYRLALELELSGCVGNDTQGVLIEAEGDAQAIERLLSELVDGAPPALTRRRVGPQAGQQTGWAWKRRSAGSWYSAAQAAHMGNPAMVVKGRS